MDVLVPLQTDGEIVHSSIGRGGLSGPHAPQGGAHLLTWYELAKSLEAHIIELGDWEAMCYEMCSHPKPLVAIDPQHVEIRHIRGLQAIARRFPEPGRIKRQGKDASWAAALDVIASADEDEHGDGGSPAEASDGKPSDAESQATPCAK